VPGPGTGPPGPLRDLRHQAAQGRKPATATSPGGPRSPGPAGQPFRGEAGPGQGRAFVRSGEYYWNSGMFFFRAGDFLKAVPNVSGLWTGRLARNVTPLARAIGHPAESVDYGVVEKIRDSPWSRPPSAGDDLGSWEALYRLGTRRETANVHPGDVLALDCRDCCCCPATASWWPWG
jgi:mannose-1-phosphate guanylyltransferase